MSETTPNATPKPGYLTTEFWTTVGVHVFAVVSFILGILHVKWSAPNATLLIPIGALFVAGLAQLTYTDKRIGLKEQHMVTWGAVEVAKARQQFTTLEASPILHSALGTIQQEAPALERAVEAIDPDSKPIITEAIAAAKTGVKDVEAVAGEIKEELHRDASTPAEPTPAPEPEPAPAPAPPPLGAPDPAP